MSEGHNSLITFSPFACPTALAIRLILLILAGSTISSIFICRWQRMLRGDLQWLQGLIHAL